MPKYKGKSGHPIKLYLTTDTTVLTFYCQIDGTEHDIKEAVFVWDVEDGKILKICGKHEGDFRFQPIK
jgi:hypothetical protein